MFLRRTKWALVSGCEEELKRSVYMQKVMTKFGVMSIEEALMTSRVGNKILLGGVF